MNAITVCVNCFDFHLVQIYRIRFNCMRARNECVLCVCVSDCEIFFLYEGLLRNDECPLSRLDYGHLIVCIVHYAEFCFALSLSLFGRRLVEFTLCTHSLVHAILHISFVNSQQSVIAQKLLNVHFIWINK